MNNISTKQAVRLTFNEMPEIFHAPYFVRAVREKITKMPLDSTILRELRELRYEGYAWQCIDKKTAKYKKLC